jgi:hypothetical protein
MISKKILQAVSKQIQLEFKGSLGRCQRITERAHVLLAEQGIQTTIVIGSAAWRVGTSELANIAFTKPEERPNGSEYTQGVSSDKRFHYWLVEDDTGKIIDFSTYTFRRMLAALDSLEGEKKRTGLTWIPEYLYVKRQDCCSLNAIFKSRKDKMFYYKPIVLQQSNP